MANHQLPPTAIVIVIKTRRGKDALDVFCGCFIAGQQDQSRDSKTRPLSREFTAKTL